MAGGHAICLLDDDPGVLRATCRLLTSAGWEVESFTDPHAFLAYARTHRPLVAVIDISMPIMHGLEVQQRLSRLSPNTRVIVFSGKDDPSVRNNALAAGAVAFILKSEAEGGLLASVQSALP